MPAFVATYFIIRLIGLDSNQTAIARQNEMMRRLQMIEAHRLMFVRTVPVGAGEAVMLKNQRRHNTVTSEDSGTLMVAVNS